MNDSEKPASEETLSPKEVSEWARLEIANSRRAQELRVKEATDVATRYAAGELSAEEATKKVVAYNRRWGEALYGVPDSEPLTDEQVLQKIDQSRGETRRIYSERGASSSTTRGGR